MTMREKMARALHKRAERHSTDDVAAFVWDRMSDRDQDEFLEQADVALGALMEPTEGIIEAIRYKGFKTGKALYEAVITAAKEGK